METLSKTILNIINIDELCPEALHYLKIAYFFQKEEESLKESNEETN